MPNWCQNQLEVTGTIEALDKWRIALFNEEDITPYLIFNKIRPLPATEEDDWYEWRTTNWGTKWDIDKEQEVYNEPTCVAYSFDTAWAPPDELVKYASTRFPTLHFELIFLEEGACFAGRQSFQNGEMVGNEICNTPEQVNEFAGNRFGYMPYDDYEEEDY